MTKKIVILILAIAVISGSLIFIYRYQILQYSTDTIIRKLLPDYIRVDKIKLNPGESNISLSGFKILNAPYFSDKYLIEISEITCRYRMKGKNLLDGLEIYDPVFKNVVLNIERKDNGDFNLNKMQALLDKNAVEKKIPAPAIAAAESAAIAGKKISDVLKIPETFNLKGGKIIFADSYMLRTPSIITFENIEADLSLKLNDYYSRVLSVVSRGKGNVNGNGPEVVNWDIKLNPTTPRLTMSNRFEVSNVNMVPLRPYYDKYSPFIIKRGRFSGELIFDFDNGNIGSTNEIHLSNLIFSVKPGYENAAFWETTVPDLVKYFSTPYGEIVFDFKIKGDMSEPRFYLGPISKQAIAAMAIDKISTAIQQASGKSASGGASSNMDKAKEYIDLFQGLMKK